jgi:lysozyme family protein
MLKILLIAGALVALAVPSFAADCGKALLGWPTADGTRIAGTLANEGLWVKNPADPGGETYRGITRKFVPKWRGWTMVDSAKIGQQPKFGTKAYRGWVRGLNSSLSANSALTALVVSFYHDGVWSEIRGDEIVSQYLAFKLFDLATNMGTGTAIILVEKTINDLNGKAKDFPVKGVMTAEMVRWLNEFTAPQKLADGSESHWRRWCFFSQLKLNAEARYGKLIARNPKLNQFWETWDDRNRNNR